MTISIHDHELPDDTHNIYDVTFFDTKITTLVTTSPHFVNLWISETLQLNNNPNNNNNLNNSFNNLNINPNNHLNNRPNNLNNNPNNLNNRPRNLNNNPNNLNNRPSNLNSNPNNLNNRPSNLNSLNNNPNNLNNRPNNLDNRPSNLNSLNSNPNNFIVGLDIEWRPNQSRNVENPVAIIQLCVGTRCLIFQILHCPNVPKSLKDFLSNKNYSFVGVGIENDVEKLIEDYNLSVGKMVDVRALASEVYGLKELKNSGIKDLSVRVLGKEIRKPKSVTMSRWDNEWLVPSQVQYACVDAFLSYEIGRVLMNGGGGQNSSGGGL